MTKYSLATAVAAAGAFSLMLTACGDDESATGTGVTSSTVGLTCDEAKDELREFMNAESSTFEAVNEKLIDLQDFCSQDEVFEFTNTEFNPWVEANVGADTGVFQEGPTVVPVDAEAPTP